MDMKEMKLTAEMYAEIASGRAKSIVSKSKFLSNEHAEAGKMIEFAISIFIGAALIGAAVTAVMGTNTSTWDTTTLAIWAILGVIIVAIFVLMLYNTYGKRGGGGKGRKGGF